MTHGDEHADGEESGGQDLDEAKGREEGEESHGNFGERNDEEMGKDLIVVKHREAERPLSDPRIEEPLSVSRGAFEGLTEAVMQHGVVQEREGVDDLDAEENDGGGGNRGNREPCPPVRRHLAIATMESLNERYSRATRATSAGVTARSLGMSASRAAGSRP